MDDYFENQINKENSLENWEPVSLGGLKPGAADWITKDYQDEMLGSAYIE